MSRNAPLFVGALKIEEHVLGCMCDSFRSWADTKKQENYFYNINDQYQCPILKRYAYVDMIGDLNNIQFFTRYFLYIYFQERLFHENQSWRSVSYYLKLKWSILQLLKLAIRWHMSSDFFKNLIYNRSSMLPTVMVKVQ